jgi:hypothetical protein
MLSSAVEAVLRANESKHRGTPMRAVAVAAGSSGFQVVPAKPGSSAEYLRLVFESPDGAIVLYLHANRLTATAKSWREFASRQRGAHTTPKDVQFPFHDRNPLEVLNDFKAQHAGRPPRPAGTARPTTGAFSRESAASQGQRPVHISPPLPRPVRRARHALAWSVTAVVALLVLLVGVANGVWALVGAAGLAILIVGIVILIRGRFPWARLAGRRMGAGLAAAGLLLAIPGLGNSPAPAPSPLAVTAPTTAAANPSAAELATAAAESSLTTAEFSHITSVANVSASTLLDDTATQSAISGATPSTALAALAAIKVAPAAPMAGYSRSQFGNGWVDIDHNGCDTRNDILARDLAGIVTKPETRNCVVLSGSLIDPYSGAAISFQRGQTTSEAVQIDHVVSLADAWRTGAQDWTTEQRTKFANDVIELLAVSGPLNDAKGDGDAATWLPPNSATRCNYVARQVAIKATYGLWMTPAEKDASATVLSNCSNEPLPYGVVVSSPPSAPVIIAPLAGPAPAEAVPAPADHATLSTTSAPARTTAATPRPVPAPKPAPAPAPKPAPAPAPAPAPKPGPAPAPAPAPSGYKAGQFCKAASVGQTAIASNGNLIKCEDTNNDGHPHWVNV